MDDNSWFHPVCLPEVTFRCITCKYESKVSGTFAAKPPVICPECMLGWAREKGFIMEIVKTDD